MTQKTAMQQMLEWVTSNYPNFNAADIEAKIEELLATEKEQIIDAWDNAYSGFHSEDVDFTSGEQFYNQTYGQ